MKIAIDFDGTCVFHSFPHYTGDVPGAADVLRELASYGHQLILYTMRSDKTEVNTSSDKSLCPVARDYLTEAVNWFAERGIPLYGIQKDPDQKKWTESPKCYAELYIDDAALGCPLVQPGSGRPYADWEIIRNWLVYLKILK